MPRQRKVDPEHVQTLEQRLAKVQRDLRKARAAQKDQARAEDAHRKIVAGALALQHRDKNPESEFGKVMFELLNEYTRPDDRRLFDFLPTRKAPASHETSDTREPAEIEAAE